MADAGEPDLFADVQAAPPASSQPQASAEPDLFAGVAPAASAAPGAPAAPTAAPSAPNPQAQSDAQTIVGNEEGQVPDWARGALDDALGLGVGATKGLFAAKDFFASGGGLWGTPPAEQDRSQYRQTVDALSNTLSAKGGLGYSFAEGTGQVAVGLLGASKFQWGGAAVKTGIAAIATAASFEPHAANLANLAQSVPGLNGPITQFFASNENDSAFLGYAKNAMVSLGFEGATVAAFLGASKLLKALRGGDADAISSAHADLEQTLQDRGGGEWTSTTPPESSSPSASASEPSATSPSPSADASGGTVPPPSGELPPPAPSASAAADVRQVASPTEGAAQIGQGLPPAAKLFNIDDDALGRIIDSSQKDVEAISKFGSWDAAIAAGHTFGGEDRIPWQVIGGTNLGTPETALDAFIARVRDNLRGSMDDMKGGEVQTDAMNARAVAQRANLWNQDPAALMGLLQSAGARSSQLRADMQAGFLVAQRALQDAWTLSQRIKLGDLGEWGGSRDAAIEALRQQAQVGATAFGAANSVLSNAARTMRGAGAQFRLTPEMVRNLQSLDGDSLVQLFDGTSGDPMALTRAVQPTMWQRALEGIHFYYVNGLISNPLTHAVIAASNTFQVFGRPGMRMAGSLLNGSWDTAGRQAAEAYGHMASSVPEALDAAWRAFKAGDSIIAPHDVSAAMDRASGGSAVSSGIGQTIAQMPWVPLDNEWSYLKNIGIALAKTGAVPSRAVSFQDEFVKQIVYRSEVQASALVEGSAQGMTGDGLAQYVKGKLFSAFDEYGRATDMAALNKAKIATYQNDLVPGTQGAKAQQYFAGNPYPRFIVPFLRTPVNLFRQSVQLTPGLNLLQTEYRKAFFNAADKGAQAQAYGQMMMGSLLMASAGLLAYQGYVTGDEPSDPKLASDAMATGWRPHSIVIPHADGTKTYIPFDRYDPIMMPMAMAANIVSVLNSPDEADQNKAEPMLAALGTVFLHQLTDKVYLQNFKDMLDTVQDPEHRLGPWAGKFASSFVPMSSALRLANPDPMMREAYDFHSALLGKMPGFSPDIAAKRDWAGDPVSVHKGLWLTTPEDAANAEVQRLALQQGASLGAPSAKARGGSDLRGITLAGDADPDGAGKNAYDRFQELAGHPERMPGAPAGAVPLRDAVTKLIQDPRYAKMPDGAPDEQGTKIAALTDLIRGYRKGALAFVGRDSNVRQAEYAETMRVAKANGYTMPNAPTATNTADGVINRLGRMIGISGMHAPSPATPNLGGP